MLKNFFAVITISIFAFACSSDTTDPSLPTSECPTDPITYTNDIKSIMDSSCATSGCHNSSTRADGIDLSTLDLVRSESSSSDFLGSIRHESGYEAMPRGSSKLPEATINKIACWVQNGKPE